MKIEKVDRVAGHFKGVDKAEKLFSGLLGIEFQRAPLEKAKRATSEHADSAFNESKIPIPVCQ
jgi:hypothetical protein